MTLKLPQFKDLKLACPLKLVSYQINHERKEFFLSLGFCQVFELYCRQQNNSDEIQTFIILALKKLSGLLQKQKRVFNRFAFLCKNLEKLRHKCNSEIMNFRTSLALISGSVSLCLNLKNEFYRILKNIAKFL